MEIIKAGGKNPSEQRTATFTGTVYGDPVLSADGTTVASVCFAPASRTYWHSHERGQLLHVVSGRGLICTAGETPRAIGSGDVIWVPPGERHWHGGGPDTMLLHLAVSLGTTSWAEPVSDAEYLAG
jgi:quercetin dioxygenase-like cupin family protein